MPTSESGSSPPLDVQRAKLIERNRAKLDQLGVHQSVHQLKQFVPEEPSRRKRRQRAPSTPPAPRSMPLRNAAKIAKRGRAGAAAARRTNKKAPEVSFFLLLLSASLLQQSRSGTCRALAVKANVCSVNGLSLPQASLWQLAAPIVAKSTRDDEVQELNKTMDEEEVRRMLCFPAPPARTQPRSWVCSCL